MEIPDYFFPAIIGAIGAVVTNIIYFEYRFYKERRLDFLKMQIDELLLPLFIKMKFFESQMLFNEAFEGYTEPDIYKTITEKDEDIRNIVKEKLNLATPKLSKLLLDFINYQYINASGSFEHVEGHIVSNNFLELKQEVINEYEQKVKEYQNMNPWWQFWQK